MGQHRTAIDLVQECVSLFAALDAGPELRALVAPLDVIKPSWGSELFRKEDDPDLAWLVARVAFAIGHPDARESPDMLEVQRAVTAALAFHTVKHTKYYRIGDSMWGKLVVFCLCPVAGGDARRREARLRTATRAEQAAWPPRKRPPRHEGMGGRHGRSMTERGERRTKQDKEQTMKIIQDVGAQGDVFFVRVDETPELPAAKATDRQFVLAHSETGHHHTVAADGVVVFQGPSDPFTCYLRVDGDYADIVHHQSFDTHETLRLTRGTWMVRRQVEGSRERFLRARCGTGRQFAIPVPPETPTAIAAQAWIHELPEATIRKMEART